MGSSSASINSPAPKATPKGTMVRGDLADRESWLGRTNRYLPGEIIGDRYRLEREIGRGGMGVVWVARSLVLGVDVALKLMHSAETEPENAARMAREANAAARVAHPALVRVFDFGWTEHGDPYLVMELIIGEPLSEPLAREETMTAIAAVQTLLPIVDGLRTAHERGIVHRDIKPGNIIVSKHDAGRTQPKLLDFGIAKIDHGRDNKLTQEGVVLGSPEYMSPEQALGLPDVDSRSDIWSLAVALYELIVGKVPFSRQNYNALMQAIIHDDPPELRNVGADEELWNVVAGALAKDREKRWQTMEDFGTALAHWLFKHGIKADISGNSLRAVWLNGKAIPLPPSGPPPAASKKTVDESMPWRKRTGWTSNSRILAGAIAASLLGLVIALSAWSSSETRSAVAAPEANGSGQALADTPKQAEQPSVRPVFEVEDLQKASEDPKQASPARKGAGARPPSKPYRKPKATRNFGF